MITCVIFPLFLFSTRLRFSEVKAHVQPKYLTLFGSAVALAATVTVAVAVAVNATCAAVGLICAAVAGAERSRAPFISSISDIEETNS